MQGNSKTLSKNDTMDLSATVHRAKVILCDEITVTHK